MDRLTKIFIFLVVAAFLAGHIQFVDNSVPSLENETQSIAGGQLVPGLIETDLMSPEENYDYPQLILPDNAPFFDTSGHWAETSIGLVKSIGLCQGYPDGSFRPDEALSQLEALQLLMPLFDTVDMPGAEPVSEAQIAMLPAWGQAAAQKAAQSGMIKLEDFAPSLSLERATLVKWLVQIGGCEPDFSSELPFADADSFSVELAESIACLYQQGVIKGYPDQKFHPQWTVSRADMMMILTRLLSATDPIHLSILSVNDFHGALLESDSNPGAAKLATYINTARARNPEGTIVLSGGDMLQGSVNSNLLEDEPVIEVMNALGFAAMAIGHREYGWGVDILEKRARQAKFPFLTCNISDKRTGQLPTFAQPYILIDKAGIKIGIIGFTTPETGTKILPSIIANCEISEPTAKVNALVRQLRQSGAQIIIVVGHVGGYLSADETLQGEAAQIAQSLQDVDVFITAHTHQQYALKYYDMAVVQAGYNGRAVAEIELYYSAAAQKVYIADLKINELQNLNLPEDETIQAIIAGSNEQISSEE